MDTFIVILIESLAWLVFALVIAFPIAFLMIFLAPYTGIALLAGLGYWNWYALCIMAGYISMMFRILLAD